jgi:hypothetical protein
LSGVLIAKMFNLPRPGHGDPPAEKRFSATNQPKRRGRPPGVQNLFSKEIKTAAVNAATRYGADGTSLGGLEGFLFRCCDLYGQTMIGLLGRICPMQKDADGERKQRAYETAEEFDAALKARGLPSLTRALALEFESNIKVINPTPETKLFNLPRRSGNR